MSSKTARTRSGTAAWRISLWSGVAFAIGTALAFWFLQSFLANDIQNRADSWLTGELGVLVDVAQRTPENRLHDVVVREVAELASREVPHDDPSAGAMNRAVFFLQTNANGQLKLHTGAGEGDKEATDIQAAGIREGHPATLFIQGFDVPFRVATSTVPNGDRVYLALSTSYERRVLHRLRLEFAFIWCGVILFGTSIVFVSTRRTLHRVQVITDIADSIGRNNLKSRVPALGRNDEIAGLSLTLNKMLDRIESSVEQLHAMSDALAHDIRSPITTVRGKLELALMSGSAQAKEEAMVQALDEIDRLSSLLSTSLDLSEATADALRLRVESVNLSQMVGSLVGLYEPSFSHAGIDLLAKDGEALYVQGDAALLQRMFANLFDNAVRHLPAGTSLTITLHGVSGQAEITFDDNGPGFPEDVLNRIFTRYSKGVNSAGRGLGLAFVAAVVRSHGGSVFAINAEKGARIALQLPLFQPAPSGALATRS